MRLMKKIFLIIIVDSLVIFSLNILDKPKNNIAIYLDNEEESKIPKKGEATYLRSVCDKDVDTTWDKDIWGIKINNLTEKVNCKLYFSSDTEKPTWQISNISKTSGFTTDNYEIEITGRDNKGVISNLTINDLAFKSGEDNCSVFKKSLNEVSKTTNEVKYQLNLSMPGCTGSLNIQINENTLTDSSSNTSDKVSLNTGITIGKNNTKKILIWKDYQSDALNGISKYYSNVTSNETLNTTQIINGKYDLIVFYYPYWAPADDLNTLYNAGLNLLVNTNDYNEDLLIFDTAKGYLKGGATATLTKTVKNNLTSYFSDTLTETDGGGICYWHFNSKAKVLYQTTYNGVTYDKIGYLKENNHIWFHNGAHTYLAFPPIMEFIFGNLEE